MVDTRPRLQRWLPETFGSEFKMTSLPTLREAIDKVDRSFADTPDLRQAIMLAAAYEIIERLIR